MRANRRIYLNIFWIVLGITLIALSIAERIDTIYSGMGGGFTAVGILQLIRSIRYIRNPDYREAVDIAENDERYRYLRMKAWACVGYLCVIGPGLALFVFMAMGQTFYMQLASYFVCTALLAYLVFYTILCRKN